jgi:tetratricopeptide (TPR) repeat protein
MRETVGAPAHSRWQSRPLFVSSTFNDMHAERDWLQSHVFPELQERLQARARYLSPVDLRWGVASSDDDEAARNLTVLQVCFGELRRCLPFFIALVGDRYGWVPPADHADAALRAAGLGLDGEGKSITELEIEAGLLSLPADERDGFVYMRAPLPYHAMPAQVAAVFDDATSPAPGAGERAARLAALKQRLVQQLPRHVRRYEATWDEQVQRVVGLEAFGRQVLEDLWGAFERAIPAFEPPVDSHAEERWMLAEFVDHKTRYFVGRGEVTAEALAVTGSHDVDAARGVVIAGEPGMGKSTMFAHLLDTLEGRGTLVLANAAGISTRASDVSAMLERWCAELMAAGAGEPHAFAEDVVARFNGHLGRIAAVRPVVLLIDAVEEFEPTARAQYMTWLPRPLPARVRLVVTARPGRQAETLAERFGLTLLPLPPITAEDTARVVEHVGRRFGRTLPGGALRTLVSKAGADGAPAAGNPLWLELALEQLHLLDINDYRRADAQPGSPGDRIERLLEGLVAEMPSTVDGLYEWTLERIESHHNTALARGFAALTAASRKGWRDSDLRRLLPAYSSWQWNDLDFSAMRRGFGDHLVRRGLLGQWAFAHAQLYAAVRRRVRQDGAAGEEGLHRLAADYLEGLSREDPMRRGEMMFHLLRAGDPARAARHFAAEPDSTEAADASVEAVIISDRHFTNPAIELVKRFYDPSLDSATHVEISRRLLDQVIPRILNEVTPASSAALLSAMLADLRTCAGATSRSLTQAALITLGDLRVSMGDSGGALAAFDEARQRADEVLRDMPDAADMLADLATALQRIGNQQLAAGDVDAALGSYRQSVDICRRVLAAQPENILMARNAAAGASRVGDALWARDQVAAALDAYQEAHRQTADLIRRMPGNRVLLRDMTIACEKLGQTYRAQQNLTAAEDNYRESLAIAESLCEQEPWEPGWRYHSAIANQNLGTILLMQKRAGEARACFATMHTDAGKLARIQPSNAVWAGVLAMSHVKLGEAEYQLGDAAAARSFRAALPILESLAAQDPTNSEVRSLLVFAYAFLSETLEAAGETAEAEIYADLRKRQVKNLSDDRLPLVVGGQQMDVVGSVAHGGVVTAQEKFERSLQQAASEAGTPVLRIAPDAPDLQAQIGALMAQVRAAAETKFERLVKQAEAETAAGRARHALELYEAGISLLGEEPREATGQARLAELLVRCGELALEGLRDINAALEYFRRARRWHERGAAPDATSRINLLIRTGEVLAETGENDGAIAAFEDALTQLRLADGGTAHELNAYSVICNKIGQVLLLSRNEPAAALEYFHRGRDAAVAAAREVNAGEYQRSVAVSQDWIAHALIALGRPKEAVAELDKALRIWEQLVEANPGLIKLQHDAAICLQRLGDARADCNELDAALAAYTRSADIFSRLAALAADNAQWLYDVAVASYKLAALHSRRGEEAQARDHLLRCHNVLQRMADAGAYLGPEMQRLLSLLEMEK